MKELGKLLKLTFLGTIVMFFSILSCKAASFQMTSSVGRVSARGSFTVRVGGDCIGRVNLTISNGTLANSSVWVEQGYVTVRVTAGTSGSVTVTATPVTGFSDADANLYNPGSRSVTVAISASNSTTSNVGSNSGTTAVPKSGNNKLATLTVDSGKLSPSFQADKTEYSMELGADTTSVTIGATPAFAKAKISGIGKVNVKPGMNHIKITVIAENGAKKVYTIRANVDSTPQVYFDYHKQKIGVVRDFEGVSIPKNFRAMEHTVDNHKISVFQQEELEILYGINDKKETDFYLFDKENNALIYKFTPVTVNGREIYVVDADISKEHFVLDHMEIDHSEVVCYRFLDEGGNYCLLSAVNLKGNILEYLYEKTEHTLQLYPEFLSKCEQPVNNSVFIICLLGGIIVVLLGLLCFFLVKGRRRSIHEQTH